MIFHNIEFLYLLILLVPLLFVMRFRHIDIAQIFHKSTIISNILSSRLRTVLLLVAMILMIIALARPQINNGEIKVKSSFINVITAIDMSKSMFANDVYPTRFEFAKKKFLSSLEYFKNAKIALLGFSSYPFLISPLTQDFYSLKFLTQNLNIDSLSLKGTDILAMLSSANEMFGEEKTKIMLLFTDGGDQSDFSQEIAYAKAHNIVIYVYNIGTAKGGVVKTDNGMLKDASGNLVILKRTDNIKALALQSGGGYMSYSFAKGDIQNLCSTIHSQFQAKDEEQSSIKDIKEMFYYPLGIAILFMFLSLFSVTNRRKI